MKFYLIQAPYLPIDNSRYIRNWKYYWIHTYQEESVVKYGIWIRFKSESLPIYLFIHISLDSRKQHSLSFYFSFSHPTNILWLLSSLALFINTHLFFLISDCAFFIRFQFSNFPAHGCSFIFCHSLCHCLQFSGVWKCLNASAFSWTGNEYHIFLMTLLGQSILQCQHRHFPDQEHQGHFSLSGSSLGIGETTATIDPAATCPQPASSSTLQNSA